jgi:integrase
VIKARTLKRTGKNVYDVELRDANGRKITKTFPTKTTAKQYETQQRAAKIGGMWINPHGGGDSVSSVAEQWLSSDPTKRPSSIARDSSILNNHVLPVIGGKAIGAVTRADIMAMVKTWGITHRPSSVGRMYTAMGAMFSYAVAAEMIARTPCTNIRLPRAELTSRPASIDPVLLEQLADELGEDQAAFMWIGVVLGLRWAEVAGLTVGALDLMHGRISVTAQLGRDGTLGPPKSFAGTRTMAVPSWLIDMLAALMKRRGLTAADPGALLFVNGAGSALSYTNWRKRMWLPATEAAGLSGLKFHDLRSLATSALIAGGADVKTTQTRMGHSSPQVTLALYARASAANDIAAAEMVGAIFAPGKHSAG